MRKGKMIAQGSHASMKVILDLMNMHPTEEKGVHEKTLWLTDGTPLMDWIEGIFTKICVSVDSEAELLEIYNKAKDAGLICSMIQDAGLTEFGGVPTYTCCAIGPAWDEDVNKITGHLKLL
jgi:PTH2 family peptidyl-tRNA hydrolase